MAHYDRFPPYVRVADRRKLAEKEAAKARKAGKQLSPITPSGGAIAKTFWGKAWCENLERYSDYANRLPRGRTYVRNGSVIDLRLAAGEVRALVMGSALYTVRVTVRSVAAAAWTALGNDCAGNIASLVDLLQGRLSQAVMARFCVPRTGLFPATSELSFSCSCPDSAGMCKHVAAVFYGIGARLDESPALLFALRGVDVNELLAKATAGVARPKKPSPRRTLGDAVLADVFGLEMADAPAAAAKPGKATSRKKAGEMTIEAALPRQKTAAPVSAGAKSRAGVPGTVAAVGNVVTKGSRAGPKSAAAARTGRP